MAMRRFMGCGRRTVQQLIGDGFAAPRSLAYQLSAAGIRNRFIAKHIRAPTLWAAIREKSCPGLARNEALRVATCPFGSREPIPTTPRPLPR